MQDEFGLYVYKVNVRREDEIVVLFFFPFVPASDSVWSFESKEWHF